MPSHDSRVQTVGYLNSVHSDRSPQLELRHGDDVPAQLSADRDVASAQNETTAPAALSLEDLDEIGAFDVAAPLAAVPGVLELSEEVQDRIAADNDALTDAFAVQAMEQSTPNEAASSPHAQSHARFRAVGIAGLVVSALTIAVVRRLRRGRNKASDKSSQRVSGSTRGSREGAGSVRSGGSFGIKSSAARSQSRRGAASITSIQGPRRSEARSEAARSRSDRVTADRSTAETTVSCAVDRKSSTGEPRTAPLKPKSTAPAPDAQAEPNPVRQKRVPPLLSGNKARSRSDKDSESDNPASASSTAASKGSPATTQEQVSSERQKGPAVMPSDTPKPVRSSAAATPSLPDSQLNVNAQEFRPRSGSATGKDAETQDVESCITSVDATAPSPTPELPSSMSTNGRDQSAAAAQPSPPEESASLALADETDAELQGQAAVTTAPAVEPLSQQSGSLIDKMKFNVDAPAFRPSSATSVPTQEANTDADVETNEAHSSSDDGEQDIHKLGAAGGVGEVQGLAGPSAGPVSSEEVDDQDLEFSHRTLELVGSNIAADAEETPDEKLAAQQLLDLAKELQRMGGGRATASELQEKGLKELKQDVNFCISSQCRPLKVAEHASTAADFFFQLQLFDAAEEMLDIGVQAARMAGDAALEMTLMHNLATALRKRGKYNTAIKLHRSFKADIEAREGITSEYVVLARHSIVDILTTRGRGDECRAYLDDEVAKLEGHLATVKADQEGKGDADHAKLARALQAIARCKLDYAKHFEACERQEDAIAMGRDALSRHRAAAELDPGVTVPMYANFLAVQLRVKGHRLKNDGQDEEALALYHESRDLFVELAEIVETQEVQGRKNRRLPMVYRQIADISMDLKDFESAFKATDQFVSSIMSVYQCRPSDPSMQQVWEYKAGIHSAASDAEGAANAHKQALKCKSSIARARGSHKSKQRKDSRGL